MKYFLLITMSVFCITSCNMRRQKARDTSNNMKFVIDTNLQQEYLDVDPLIEYMTGTQKSIISAEKAFEKVKPSINDLVEKGIIHQTPFHIHLVNDSIWIIRNEVTSSEKELFFGGTVYFEVRKKDGCILKCIVEE